MGKIKTESLFARLIKIHLVFALCLVVVVIIFQVFGQQRSSERHLDEYGRLAANMLRLSCVDPVVNTLAYDRIQALVQYLYHDSRDIAYISIYDITGGIVGSEGLKSPDNLKHEELAQFLMLPMNEISKRPAAEAINEFVSPLRVGNDVLGVARVGMTNKHARAELYRDITFFIGIALLSLVISGLIYFFFTRKRVFLPLKNVSEIMNDFGKTELNTLLERIKKLDLSLPHDEIGTMSRSFEEMILTIISYDKKRRKAEETLKKSHNELEIRVKERTAALEKTNKELRTEIAERKRAEEALTESEIRYKEMFENMSNGAAVYKAVNDGEDFVIVDFNRASERIDALKRRDVIGNSILRVFPGVKDFGLFEVLQRVWSTGKAEHYPVSLYKDERISGWRDNFIYKLPSGEVVAIYSDETERKQAEETLRESERNLKAVLGASPVGIGLVVNRKLDWANETMYRMVGYEQDSLPGQSARILYPDDEEFERAGREIYAGFEESGTGQTETRWIRKDGTVFDCILRICPLDPSDLAKGQIVAVTDVSELKFAHEELRKSEAEKKAILDGITTNIRLVDENLEILWVNKAGGASTDKSPEEMIGHKCYEFWGDQEQTCADCPAIKTITEKRTNQIIRYAPDGKVWDLKTEPVVDDKGSLAGVVEIAHDITDKSRLEAQLQQAQKMEAMGLMAGGIAHDLNNILSGIVSYPELLLMDLPEDSPLKKPIKTIQESGMRAADVVADLLTIARGIATGKETLNLNTIVTEYLESPEYQKLDKTHSFVNFETELGPDLLNMSGSGTHIKKTLMNLVVNASEAIDGRGTVTISSMNRYLDEPLKGYEGIRTGEYAVLSVSDDGSGMTPEDLEKIFEPFYTKKVMDRSGTGLGLAVVWNTVQDHNGYINVESSGKGTVFELYFPVTRKDISDEKEKTPLENYLGHGEKILVVDDEEGQRMIACGMLTKLGYMAEAVSSGEEAIEYMKENAVDLIVLDMVMPKGINGRETYQGIIKIRPGQKAVIASGYAKTKEVDMAQELGAGKYIRKPYTLEKIGVAVKKELKK